MPLIFDRAPRHHLPRPASVPRIGEEAQGRPKPPVYPRGIDDFLDEFSRLHEGTLVEVLKNMMKFRLRNPDIDLPGRTEGVQIQQFPTLSSFSHYSRQVFSYDPPDESDRWYMTIYREGNKRQGNIEDGETELRLLIETQRALGRKEAEMIARKDLKLGDVNGMALIVPDLGLPAENVVYKWLDRKRRDRHAISPISPQSFRDLFYVGLRMDPLVCDFESLNNIVVSPSGALSFIDLTPDEGGEVSSRRMYTEVMNQNAILAGIPFADLPPEIQDMRRGVW